MASTSSSCASMPTHYKYEVFLRFRGEDTRYSFTDHLYKALCQSGYRTFRDDDEIRDGRELKPEIERAIIESRASVIVLSENFANSRWCLEELWLILEQKRKGHHFALPVFYGVDPSDVRNQRGSFTIDAKEGAEGLKWSEANVRRWKAALTEVADLKGMSVSGRFETTFIEDVVQNIYCELDMKLVGISTKLVGIDTRAIDINTWLKNEQPRSPVLAICGIGGIGKTTLAKYVYTLNKKNFECSSFLEVIENQPSALLGLQKQLLRDLGNSIMISNVSEGTFLVEKALQSKKALIVIDGIDDLDQLNTLFGTKALHTRGKIIITTRHLRIDTAFESISSDCNVYKVELLNHDDSLELLSWHAFGSKIPIEGFEELASQLAQFCEGNPLALQVLGSSLPVRASDQWTINNMIETWRSRINSLMSMKGHLDQKIQRVLYKSYESLPCENQRELFLHIACLFINEYTGEVEKTLEKDWHAKFGITTLINRCLVTKSSNGFKLAMHKLLRDMASKIVRDESKDPAKRSRVWHKDEAYRLLRNGDGSKTIEGLRVNMRDPEQWMTSEAFKTSSLVKMKILKFLQLDYVKLTGSYENFPNLRWLRWHGCNLKTVPPGLLTSCLVALHLNFGDLEEFDPPMVLDSLTILDLTSCRKLVSILNLDRLPKLVSLILNNCTSLTHVCKTIEGLENLSLLSLIKCTKLWKASPNEILKNQQEKLKALSISGGLPELLMFSIPQTLFYLSLSSNPFEIMHSYIDLKMLGVLQLNFCSNLKSLPCLPRMLKRLYVDWCTSLENITFQSGQFTLQVFDYEGCFKLCEIQGLFKLVPIAKLEKAELGRMQWIKVYQDYKVDLAGDVITKGRNFNIQMLYEYGIRSTFLRGIKDQSRATHDYTSSSEFLSFRVPLDPNKRRIQGLNVTYIYRLVGADRNLAYPLFARISNKTKSVTWVYNPVVYCKPKAKENALWLSYWPIGNTLDAGDEVEVDIIGDAGAITCAYGASLVYMDGEVENEEKSERIQQEQEIGGDLSLMEVTKGCYYLCRRDFFESTIPGFFFGDDVQITGKFADSRRWRTHGQLEKNNEGMNKKRNPNRDFCNLTLGVNFNCECEAEKIKKAISNLVGVESVSTDKDERRLLVCGRFDPSAVVKCVREFENMVQIMTCDIIPEQELKKIDDESDDEFFDFPEPFFDDEPQD